MTSTLALNRLNVGRIAERIVANELEARGFRVSDLSREDRIAANADLLAAGHGNRVWQIQVKGATNSPKEKWWLQYGFCTLAIIKKAAPMFNRREGFYRADVVVLVAVRTPTEYLCVVLPIDEAERAAQLNLDHAYRTQTRDGREKKPHKVWVSLEPKPREDRVPPDRLKSIREEREIIQRRRDAWDILQTSLPDRSETVQTLRRH